MIWLYKQLNLYIMVVLLALFIGCDSRPDSRDTSSTSEIAPESAEAEKAEISKNNAAGNIESGGGDRNAAYAIDSQAKNDTAKKSDSKIANNNGDWPMWGGSPTRNMVNLVEKNIPHEWEVKTRKNKKTKNIKFKAGLGSQSYGNPVIANGKIFVGTNNELKRNTDIVGDKGVIMCFNETDGKFLWQAIHDKLPAGRVNDWPLQGICSAPIVENGRLYYVSNRAELICADVEGFMDGKNNGPYKEEKYKSKIDGDFIWILDMIEELTVFPHNLATSSPVIGGDLIFILTSNGVDEGHVDIPSPRAPSFIAVNKMTGKVVWEDDSPGKNILHGQWGSPAYGDIAGITQVICPGGDGFIYSFEPETGNILWKFDCNPPGTKWELYGNGTKNNILATPVIFEDRVYIAVGQDPEHGEGDGHLYRINPVGKSGDISTNKHAVDWHYGGEKFKRTMSSVAVHDGLVYAADLSGFLHCLDQKTGKQYWVHDMLAAVWSSPTVIDGKVFLSDEDGDVIAAKEGKTLELLTEEDGNNMNSAVFTSPVASKGVLYIVNRDSLYAITKQ